MSNDTLDQNVKPSSNRRQTLKAALAGSAVAATVPAAWIKPTVSSVVLPGHASTTDSGGDPGSGTPAPVCDPAITGALMDSETSVRFEGEGDGMEGVGYIAFSTDVELPTNPTSISISGAGFSTSGSTGETEGTLGNGRYFTEFDVTGNGSAGDLATISLTIPDQPAPCTLQVVTNLDEEP
ncbi:MAG: hypothetical protein AAF402_05815 [Pseudomonadota bacterium]